MSLTSKSMFCLKQSLTRAIGIRHFSVTSSKWTDTIGFVGLGNMGAHMARNLLSRNYPVLVFDMMQDSVNSLQEAGAKVATSPADVASQTKTVVTMLPAGPHVRAVYTGDNGIFSSVQSGALLIDSSTIEPSTSQEMAKLATDKGAIFLDAPVSGGVVAARDALLTFMVGGPDKYFAPAKDLLSNMGKNVVHCGPVGTGQAAKVCNNMLLGISMIGVAETMNLGIKLGLDPKLLANILNMSSGRCWSSELYNPCPGVVEGIPTSNDYKGGFGVTLMAKDLGLAQTAATATKSPTPMGSLAHQLYRIMSSSELSEKDFASVYRFLQQMEAK